MKRESNNLDNTGKNKMTIDSVTGKRPFPIIGSVEKCGKKYA
jgi:hypothetical protein